MATKATSPITSITARPTAAQNHLRKVDPRMTAVIKAVGPLKLREREPSLHLLCSSIIGQSISLKAAACIVERFNEKVGGPAALTARHVLKHDEDTLKNLGLNRTKAGALRGVAELWHAEKWDAETVRQIPDAELLDKLTTVRGIGPWTAKMFLIFGLRRPDVLPQEDLGLRAGLHLSHGLGERPSPKAVIAMTDCWAPWRTVGTLYVWQYLMKQSELSLDETDSSWF